MNSIFIYILKKAGPTLACYAGKKIIDHLFEDTSVSNTQQIKTKSSDCCLEDHLKSIRETKLTEKQWREISYIDKEKYNRYLNEERHKYLDEEKYLIQPYGL